MNGAYLEDLEIGQTAELKRTVQAGDLDAFAQVTGDTNPVHLDEAYAAGTAFKGRIAHGML
ncbi:MAG TPA: MaoC/PaaZ C-terminal domain-containing protein, partial [Caulobacteraceae bacterium]|nr:MaoC/PaaZ C-terminal domain-containing protein [Caulobacteraceae bacterium]